MLPDANAALAGVIELIMSVGRFTHCRSHACIKLLRQRFQKALEKSCFQSCFELDLVTVISI